MSRLLGITLAVLLSCSAVTGQIQAPTTLPCDYKADVLHAKDGSLLWFDSIEMKRRAIHKQDVGGFMKQVDIRGAVLVAILVGPNGGVMCVKMLHGHPIIAREVADALKSWRFSSAVKDGKQVAYLGRMQFNLCNINCGKQGFQTSILNQ